MSNTFFQGAKIFLGTPPWLRACVQFQRMGAVAAHGENGWEGYEMSSLVEHTGLLP